MHLMNFSEEFLAPFRFWTFQFSHRRLEKQVVVAWCLASLKWNSFHCRNLHQWYLLFQTTMSSMSSKYYLYHCLHCCCFVHLIALLIKLEIYNWNRYQLASYHFVDNREKKGELKIKATSSVWMWFDDKEKKVVTSS